MEHGGAARPGRLGSAFFAAPAKLFGGLVGGPLPGGCGQHIRFGRNQTHSTTKMSTNKAHHLDSAVQVRQNFILKEKPIRKYPRIEEGDYVRVFDKGKGSYVSRKEAKINGVKRNIESILKVVI